ncbi:MAG: hypothetical protein V3U31_05635 [Dehalococcoidia bacterium]
MKSRGEAKRRQRGRRKQGTQRQPPPTPTTPVTGPPSPTRVAAPPLHPVAGIPHRQVLDDMKKIGIIGGAALVLLLVLFLVWR